MKKDTEWLSLVPTWELADFVSANYGSSDPEIRDMVDRASLELARRSGATIHWVKDPKDSWIKG